MAPLLNGFPLGTVATSNPLVDLTSLVSEADQQEDTAAIRLDQQFSTNFSAYLRYMFSVGEVDTPDRTVTPRRVLAKQKPKNLVANFQNILGSNLVNEFKVGWNAPETSALAFGPAGYDPTGVSLSGNFTSSSIDARGTTGIARSGLLIRATSASTTVGSAFDPMSLAFSNATTWTSGAHTVKLGGEYRRIESDFQFLGSNELSYNSINDFIDNRLNQVAVTVDSPVFKPQQFYAIGFLQDSWRLSDQLTLELGLRYDYYSVVEEADDRAKPFFVEENEFGAVGDGFYDADKNNFSPRLAAAYQFNEKNGVPCRLRAVLRAGPIRGPHPADRELHHPQPRAGFGRGQQRPPIPSAGLAAARPAVDPRLHARLRERVQRPGPAPACRASFPGTSTSPSATPAARARTCSCAASATCSTR